jgi:hypothetical protein
MCPLLCVATVARLWTRLAAVAEKTITRQKMATGRVRGLIWGLGAVAQKALNIGTCPDSQETRLFSGDESPRLPCHTVT